VSIERGFNPDEVEEGFVLCCEVVQAVFSEHLFDSPPVSGLIDANDGIGIFVKFCHLRRLLEG